MSVTDRFIPSLIHRFTRPGDKYEPPTLHKFADSVRRDLRWLLESRATLDQQDAIDLPEVAKSVINYGVSDHAGTRLLDYRIMELEQQLLTAIRNFEPRIDSRTLTVRRLSDEELARTGEKRSGPNAIAFEIHAEISATPTPIKIRTELDLATGEHRLIEEQKDSSPLDRQER